MRWMNLLLFAAVLLAGCFHSKPSGTKNTRPPESARPPVPTGAATNSPAPAATLAPALKGKVVLVNPGSRFVVLTFSLGALPPLEKHFNVYRGGLKVAEIKISDQRRDNLVVADIVAGECLTGDEIKED